MYVCMYVSMYVCKYVRMYVCMYVCMHVCLHVVRTYVPIYMYICMYSNSIYRRGHGSSTTTMVLWIPPYHYDYGIMDTSAFRWFGLGQPSSWSCTRAAADAQRSLVVLSGPLQSGTTLVAIRISELLLWEA